MTMPSSAVKKLSSRVRPGVFEDGFESFDVRVNVGQDENRHALDRRY